MKILLFVLLLWALFCGSIQQSINITSVFLAQSSQIAYSNVTASVWSDQDMENTTTVSTPLITTILAVTTRAILSSSLSVISSLTQLPMNATPSSLAVPSQTSLSFPTSTFNISMSTNVTQPSSASSPPLVTSSQRTSTATSPPSRATPSLTPSPTDTSPTTVIDFVTDNPIAFTIVGISFLFLSCMCCCLCCVLIFRRLRKRRSIRREQILNDAGDAWIINPGATLRPDSPYEMMPTQPQQHNAAANVLQTSPDEAVIIANPQLELYPPPQYPNLSLQNRHTSSSAILQSSSTSQLLPMQSAGKIQPSAPPIHHIS